MTPRKRWDPHDKVEQGHLCQRAGQPAEEVFIPGMMGEGDCR